MSKPPLRGRGLDLVDVADQHGGEEAAGLQTGGALEYARVGALGVDYLAGVLLEDFHEIFKHFICLHISRRARIISQRNFTIAAPRLQEARRENPPFPP